MNSPKENRHYVNTQEAILQNLLEGKNLSRLSQKMGFSFNKVLRWKQNKKKFKWSEFVDLCEQLNLPLVEIMTDVFGISIRNKNDLKSSAIKIFTSLNVRKNVTAKSIGKSLPTLHRIRHKKSSPDFVTVLALMDQRPQYLEKFKEKFISSEATKKSTRPKSIFTCPWFSIVSSAMALKEHQSLPAHSDNWIADKTGLSIKEVKEAIELMTANQLIEKQGPHYAPTFSRTLAFSQKQSAEDFKNSLQYWTDRASKEFSKPQNELSKSFFRCFATTPEAAQEVTHLMMEYEEKVHNILTKASGEKTEIRYFVFHHLPATKQP